MSGSLVFGLAFIAAILNAIYSPSSQILDYFAAFLTYGIWAYAIARLMRRGHFLALPSIGQAGKDVVLGTLLVPLIYGLNFLNRIFPMAASAAEAEALDVTLPSLFLLLSLLSAIVEEAFFRGTWLSELETALGRPRAVVLTSVAFAIFHLPAAGVSGLAYSLLMGIGLGLVAVWRASVVAPMAAHVGSNLLATFVILREM